MAAARADLHRGAERANTRRQRRKESVIGPFQPSIAQCAAAERIKSPVQGESLSEFLCAGVDAVVFEDDRPVIRWTDFHDTPVAGQQNALFRMRLFNEVAVAATAVGDRRVVPGDAQPSAQSRQHLVAEKAQLVRHGQAFRKRARWTRPSCFIAGLAAEVPTRGRG